MNNQEEIIKIAKEIAKDVIELNDAVNEDDIVIRLDEYLENNNITPTPEIKEDIVDYIYSNEKELGLKGITGVDNQYYLVSIKSIK
jgi:hypothetical protein